MLYTILNSMYDLNIKLLEEKGKILIKGNDSIPDDLFFLIRQQKRELLNRLRENEIAKGDGFTVHHHGELYSYQYGRKAILFIERKSNGKATSWKETLIDTPGKENRVKFIHEDVPFPKAYQGAANFTAWLNKKKEMRA